jgi:uncharacterized protein
MDLILNLIEIRVLGSLVEKQIATPEYYPLSLNALMHACNQKSNRDPVVAYDEKMVSQALDTLREKKLVWLFRGADSRVPKYGHIFPEAYHINDRQVAVLCVLMLRGAQTVGEIRGRCGQLYNFEELAEVEATFRSLIERDEGPLVMRLPRQVGMKEPRYGHLLGGPIDIEELEATAPRPESGAAPRAAALGEKVAGLQEEVESLRKELAELKQQFLDFKKQFE